MVPRLWGLANRQYFKIKMFVIMFILQTVAYILFEQYRFF